MRYILLTTIFFLLYSCIGKKVITPKNRVMRDENFSFFFIKKMEYDFSTEKVSSIANKALEELKNVDARSKAIENVETFFNSYNDDIGEYISSIELKIQDLELALQKYLDSDLDSLRTGYSSILSFSMFCYLFCDEKINNNWYLLEPDIFLQKRTLQKIGFYKYAKSELNNPHIEDFQIPNLFQENDPYIYMVLSTSFCEKMLKNLQLNQRDSKLTEEEEYLKYVLEAVQDKKMLVLMMGDYM